jgi:predicted metal-dependent hydrolase
MAANGLVTTHERIPEHTVRISTRARYPRLTVTPRDGLVVVVPRRWRGDPSLLVAEKAEWARTALGRVASQRALHAAGPEALLPHVIEVRAFGETLPVEYRETASATLSARSRDGAVVVSGRIDDAPGCLAALDRWLDRIARDRLLPLLDRTAAENGLAYAGARVRHQRTRWGSCSARRTISLNRNLVFLPPALVRSILLHELAHTRVLNHSARFWTLLEALDPDARAHRALMREAHDFVPAWADA